MLKTVLQHPCFWAALALALVGSGVGIGLLIGKKRLSKAIQRQHDAESSRMIFLKNMSHDVLTPLNAIVGYTHIALHHAPSSEVLHCLEKIEASSQQLLTLVGDVLAISRMEGGKTRYQPEPLDITEVTDDVLNVVRSLLLGRDLTLEINLAKPENPFVRADRVLLREVLVGILSNAVKFTDDGGTIRFSSDFLLRDDGHAVVRYRISDTGVGMSPEFLQHLFEEFSQEDTAARTQYRGTGLGLSIAKRYVDVMGGTISVESKKGTGSTFTVELALKSVHPEDVSKHNIPTSPSDLTGVRVLLAEDNDLNAEIAVIQLEEAGMQVTRVRNGGEALVQFTSDPPGTYQVILMDIMMPKMNGYEATRAIRSLSNRPDGQSIPIIALTANAFADDVDACLNAGMNAHLAKPIVISEVLRTIARNLNP